MTYRKLILSGALVIGTITTATSGAWALDLAIDTGSHGSGPIELATLLTLITLAPALLIMLTSFTRIVIVLSLLRQALGLQQTPPEHRDHRFGAVSYHVGDGADLDPDSKFRSRSLYGGKACT